VVVKIREKGHILIGAKREEVEMSITLNNRRKKTSASERRQIAAKKKRKRGRNTFIELSSNAQWRLLHAEAKASKTRLIIQGTKTLF